MIYSPEGITKGLEVFENISWGKYLGQDTGSSRRI